MSIDQPESKPQTTAPVLPQRGGLLSGAIRFCLENKLVVAMLVVVVFVWGVLVAPFDWDVGGLPRSPVPVDAIPDIGENQQIVFTEWMGRSPQDVEDQISYPLTVSLLGLPGVKTVRSYSMFGFSSVYIIFEEDIDFYWSRSRVLEKLNSLPPDTLPAGVQPTLGPDATALGQVFWYTLEGRGPDGLPTGGWDLQELRTVQDWYVRYALTSAGGVSETASVGGFVQEYQIDVDPDALRAFNVSLDDVFNAVRMSNVDVGARTIEINRTEYVIRGLGFIKQVSDLEKSVIRSNDNVPVSIHDVARVTLGPALRRGGLDNGGAEAVGGVVVVRYGFNPLEAINNVKKKIDEIAPGLPTKALIDWQKVTPDEVRALVEEKTRVESPESRAETPQTLDSGHSAPGSRDSELSTLGPRLLPWLRTTPHEEWPEWVTTSQVTVVPFYDRSGLIYETLGTLNSALVEEILVTIIVILVLLQNFRSSVLISVLLPLAVLICFIAMKLFGVDANIVALSGIAIAIGTMVDMGIILCENILKHLDEAPPDEDRLEVIYRASTEVAGPLLAAVSTTIISFLPVFAMIGAEGKLFRPLAFTKTFALFASAVVAILIIPPAAHLMFATKVRHRAVKVGLRTGLLLLGIALLALSFYPIGGFTVSWPFGVLLMALGAYQLSEEHLPSLAQKIGRWAVFAIPIAMVGIMLTEHWLPLGVEKGMLKNLIFVGGFIAAVLGTFHLFQNYAYAPMLRCFLRHKLLFLSAPMLILLLGGCVWLGFDRVFGIVPWTFGKLGGSPATIRETTVWSRATHALPGLGKEFMPPLDEGSFLYMPTTMPHASIGEVFDVLQFQNRAIMAIPEVESAVGKLGRVDSALDPAPVSMIETIINYKSEYLTDKDGYRIDYQYDEATGEFARDEDGQLIPAPDGGGRPYRIWRDHIRTQNDIWDEIIKVAEIPGTTSAPRLQPIAARIVMLQSGMRAPMGVKIKGPDLRTIERVALEMEGYLKEVPSVEASAVIADRVVGKPYIEIEIDRDAIARYGIMIRKVQDVIEVAIGGRRITTTVEGRERYPVRVRYLRELRDSAEQLGRILVAAPDGTQVPLEQLADINFVRGPQVIKSEDTFLLAYVLFDMQEGNAEVDVVEQCQRYLQSKIDSGEFVLPAGVSFTFAGSYENQVRSQKTLMIVLPLALFAIFLNLYFQFRSVVTTSLVFSGVIVAWAGGFIMIWLYGQPWFLDFEVFGTSMRTLFQVHPINLSVAVWVGFLALYGVADDDGVVMTSYLEESFRKREITTRDDVREATVAGGMRRIRPCLMTTATTILSLIPVLTSTGRGADIMVPMAIPSVGGMLIAMLSMFIVPVLYSAVKELKIRTGIHDKLFARQS
ncbi:MAG: efflux RND transporter permease subunit [Planctomycetota bacterium]|jgi:Cu(I)/Ag(I) efflux system membrane protein CusA/SilA